MTPKKFYKTLLILTVITVLSGTVSIIYFWKILSGLSRSIYEKEVVLNNFTTKIESLEGLKSDYIKIIPYINDILYTFPAEKKSDVLLSSLEETAKNRGVKLTAYHYGDVGTAASQKSQVKDQDLLQTIKENDYYEIPLTLNVEGSYANVILFIKDLENSKRLITIKDIDINKFDSGAGGASDSVKLTSNIMAYLKKE